VLHNVLQKQTHNKNRRKLQINPALGTAESDEAAAWLATELQHY